MLTTIGIDPSLTNTGIVIIRYPRGAKLPCKRYLQRHCVIQPKGLKGAERLSYIMKEADAFLPDKADIVVIEDYNYKGQNLAELGEVQGVIKALCGQRGIPVIKVAPSALKKFATGNSQASKELMMKRYSEDNEHIADAKALAHVGQVFRHKTSTIRHELEVIMSLVKRSNPVKKRPKIQKIHPILT